MLMPDTPSPPTSESRRYSVHVRFPPSQGARLRRSEPTACGDGRPIWADRPSVMERADGTYDLIGTSAHLDGLARWVLSFGTDATVKGPEVLRQQVAAEARRIVKLYDREAQDDGPR